MALTEVFADGLGGVRIVGETLRLDFVSLTSGEEGGFDPRVRIVLPIAGLANALDLLAKAQRIVAENRGASRPPRG